jgi:hypothetical protein
MRAAHDRGTQSLPGIAYAQRPDALPDAELSTLAAIYRFVLDCHAKKEATRPGSPDNPERRSDDNTVDARLIQRAVFREGLHYDAHRHAPARPSGDVASSGRPGAS